LGIDSVPISITGSADRTSLGGAIGSVSCSGSVTTVVVLVVLVEVLVVVLVEVLVVLVVVSGRVEVVAGPGPVVVLVAGPAIVVDGSVAGPAAAAGSSVAPHPDSATTATVRARARAVEPAGRRVDGRTRCSRPGAGIEFIMSVIDRRNRSTP
jgi:hypothetical protein